jgi:hypothetical protein
MCSVCAGYYQKYRKKCGDAGVCRKCGKDVVPGHKNCEACLAKQREYNRKLKDEVFRAYGGYTCACCGETTPEFLQLDHVGNDGAEHRRQVGGVGTAVFAWCKRNGFPPGFQILCANCNYAKANYGVCPHRPDKEVNNAPRRRRDSAAQGPTA